MSFVQALRRPVCLRETEIAAEPWLFRKRVYYSREAIVTPKESQA